MSSKVVTLTAENFDAMAHHRRPGEERAAVVVGKLDVDDHAERYGIQSIPTVLVFRNGGLVSRSIGLVPIERLHRESGFLEE